MAGNEEHESENSQENNDCSFQWDEASQLYFHASTGFYHDPNAGWYYSSRDSLYYTFEDGVYVLLESEKIFFSARNLKLGELARVVSDEPVQGNIEHVTDVTAENPPPPSEWLEETLIDLYLAGYSNTALHCDDVMVASETDGSASKDANEKLPDQSCSMLSSYHDDTVEEIEEGEWIPEDVQEEPESSGRVSNEDALWDEENWRAQYGQVIQSREEGFPAFPVIDLWDWSMVAQTVGKKKRKVARLVGRLVRRSAKLHPSMPVGGGLLKTSIISDVHLDLVRVVSGQVYKLRSPSARYLASLSTYDSSNPTKDWGFPDLLANMDNTPTSDFEASHGSEAIDGESCANYGQPLSSKEKRGHVYRDRAAERRTLHGGFGIGPGQKTFANGGRGGEASCSESLDTEEAAAEAQHMSFGAGSFARRILEGMGWKEGEALGNNTRGLKEPLQAVGNKGCAGLGWNSHDRL